MPWVISLLGAIVALAAVLLFTAREIRAYVVDQRARTEIYPYTRRRLWIRCSVSGLLVFEIFLLFLFRHTLDASRPTWFVIYVGLVLGSALAMTVLALLDWRESRKLRAVTEERLYQEFVHEIGQRRQSSDRH